ncbi:MAG: nitrite/sulfite reductase [Armatimonadetes bacterium]|nr:nitrite/sulfite reductase [Armatimonadota bacterium]
MSTPEPKLNAVEKLKRAKHPLDVWDDILRYASEGYESITEDDFARMRWYGMYRQRPNDGHFMLRLKIPNGAVTAGQAQAVADLAREYARGFADITTRQDFQLHWIRIEDMPEIFCRLEEAGITTTGACGDVTRNVVGCPVAGVDPGEICDASGKVMEVSNFLLGNRDYADLPRKFKISISGCPVRCNQPEINDIGLIAARRGSNGEVGFHVRVGGGLAAEPYLSEWLDMFVLPEQALPVVVGITEIFRDCGYRASRKHARLKFLVADWGPEKFREELIRRIGFSLEPRDRQEEPLDPYRDHIGVHRQKQEGLYWVGIAVPVGRIHADDLETVASLTRRYGDGSIRNTNMQNMLILNVPEGNLPPLCRALDDAGLHHARASQYRRGLIACTGIQFCNLSVVETKARGASILEYLEKNVPISQHIRINVNGCPNSCAQFHIADIGLQGCLARLNGEKVEAFDVSLGGGLGREQAFGRKVLRRVPATEIHEVIRRILEGFESRREPGETFQHFSRRLSDEEMSRLAGATPTEEDPEHEARLITLVASRPESGAAV